MRLFQTFIKGNFLGTAMNPILDSKNHLEKSKMNYFIHFFQAFRLGLVLIWAGIASLVHAIFPFLFPAYSANKVSWMYIRVVIDSSNPDIKGYLAKELALREARVAEQKRSTSVN
jgi:hypothetical protein